MLHFILVILKAVFNYPVPRDLLFPEGDVFIPNRLLSTLCYFNADEDSTTNKCYEKEKGIGVLNISHVGLDGSEVEFI